jgi:hypothetical protein
MKLSKIIIGLIVVNLVLICFLTSAHAVQFTGCLKSGKIGNVAIGTAPQRHCRARETEVTWNSEGATGSAGVKGDTGAAGPQGEPGSLNKSSIYTRTATANLFAQGEVTLSQSCDDVNDIALSGGCEFVNSKELNYVTGSLTSNNTVLSSNGFHKCSFKSNIDSTVTNSPPSESVPILWSGNGHYYEIIDPIHVEGVWRGVVI